MEITNHGKSIRLSDDEFEIFKSIIHSIYSEMNDSRESVEFSIEPEEKEFVKQLFMAIG